MNSSTGDEWRIEQNKDYMCNMGSFLPDSDTFKVDSISTVNYGNRIFEVINGKTKGKWTIGNRVLKNIGSLSTPYPHAVNPNPMNWNPCGHKDYGKIWNLSCYSDNIRGSINFGNRHGAQCSYLLTPIREISNSSNRLSSDIKVYPNPFDRSFFVKTDVTSIASFRIIDLSGRVIQEGYLDGGRIDFNNDLTGVYILVLITEDNVQYSFKIVKI